MRALCVLLLLLLAILTTTGCGDDAEANECTPGTATGCEDGLVCEAVSDGEPACFSPVEIAGRVFDSSTKDGIAGARIVALDANGGARSRVAISAPDGAYALPIAVTRAADGTPILDRVTLRISAAGYQDFPRAPRRALPLDLSTATRMDGRYRLANAATDIALLALESMATEVGTIAGRVDAEAPGGVLVVAERAGAAVATAVSDLDGSFVLFDVPAGDVTVSGFRSGLALTPSDVEVRASQRTEGVVLAAASDALSTVRGSVNIVNAPGGSRTSVILVVESTFDAQFIRGESPAGLRAGDVTSAFSIADVPPGRYVVLAAFENDDLVRDPDESIGGTAIVRIEVAPTGGTTMLPSSFKVTEALAVVSPGRDGLEVIAEQAPTLTWRDDSSEDGYELFVYDAYGNVVHEDTAVPRVTGSADATYAWTNAALEPGMIYQFRVYSYRNAQSGRTYISATEDLRGVFLYDPTP